MRFLLPRVPNFAKIHARVGRGRLGVALRDLIPPWGTPGVPGCPAGGSGLCRVGVLPGAGMGVPDGGAPPGRGAVPGQACRGWRRCARAASLPGGGWFFPGGGAKNFFHKGPTRMYKEAVDPVSARLVDKAMFPAILWWV